ncbi:IS1595 family transposase [Bauldia litoralis]|uniref:Transposase zinc-ribbon domain-containing protein n=1 Tax=Bauldia litoralis TaxID=665467 RepID=A0A1G6CE91_9HYPH|nr:IS1595 family transposase [Bauldia litoralis]SDB31173.1 Transposase zinc-ribbon domain-containing protein [Bauldia litoralis]
MNLTDPRFTDPNKAREYLEAQRWPQGPVCSHCGSFNATTLKGKAHRVGLYQCNDCREQFTVTTGSVMERSKIPLNKWLLAMHLMGASKKGVSAHQLHRMLGIGYQAAWFLAHRIREAMKDTYTGPIGGEGKVVEADETYFGRRETPKPSEQRKGRPYLKRKKPFDKRSVVALVERGGQVRMFHVEHATKVNIRDVLVRNVDRKSILNTDESNFYTETGREFAKHQTVKHSAGEYVRYEDGFAIHSNTVENVFSVFKRGMKGTYQHCGEAHLHRYIAEFDFRYNRRTALGVGDTERVADIIKGSGGKRLLYTSPDKASHA